MASFSEQQKQEFIFTWKIKNFSFCGHTKDEGFDSPEFIVASMQSTRWFLRIYPRGRIFDHFIPCFLRRSDSDYGPENITMNYTLSILCSDESQRFNKSIDGHSFKKSSGFGFQDFVRYAEVFNDTSLYTPNDTLTIRCHMWREKCDQPSSVIVSNASSRIITEKRYFTWKIHNFSASDWKERTLFPIQCACEFLPFLHMTCLLTASNEHLQLTMERVQDHATDSLFVTLEIMVLDFKGRPLISKFEKHLYEPSETQWEFPSFIEKNNVILNASTYLVNDALTLSCKLITSSGKVSAYLEKLSCNPLATYEEIETMDLFKDTNEKCNNTLRNDIHRLYVRQKFCDVTLQTKSVYILVHKAVLAARSAVFSDMLEHNPQVKTTGVINIHDIDTETLNKLLTFIYTDSLDDLSYEISKKLYLVSMKYEIHALQNFCCAELKRNIDATNVYDLMIFAELHGRDSRLRAICEDFVCKKSDYVFRSAPWLKFMIDWPKLSGEMMHNVWLRKE